MDKKLDDRLSGLKIPRHVAVIMDGNGRWAEERELSHLAGHAAGREATKRLVDAAGRFGIDVVSVYAFSTENWQRSENEVSGLMELIEGTLRHEMAELRRQKVRVVASGRLRQLPASLQKLLADTAKATADYERLTLNLCINYGGRAEIADAARTIAVAAAAGELDPADIDTDTFANYLYQPDLPDPDLLIRTSGELRLSNFLLYQMAYTEMVILPIYWPDFDAASLIDAIEQYNGRERRYGQRKG